MYPEGLAIDASGVLYISDAGRVRKIAGGTITAFGGTGVAGHSGDGGPAASAQFGGTGALHIGPNSELYIAETYNAVSAYIRKISGGIIGTIAGNGRNETSGDCTDIFGADDNGPATNALFCGANGLAVGPSGKLFAADAAFLVVR